MSAENTQRILEQLRSLIPDATPVNHVASSRTKRDTLPEARSKTSAKLRENAAYFGSESEREKPDLVYKKLSDDAFAVGIEYGNRYLAGAIAGGTYVPKVPAAKVKQVLEMLAAQVDGGMYDDAISKIMGDNVAARNRTAH